MSDALIISVASIVVSVITATAAIASAFLGARNDGKITQLHLAVNSRLDQLVAATKLASHAEGVRDATEALAGASGSSAEVKADELKAVAVVEAEKVKATAVVEAAKVAEHG